MNIKKMAREIEFHYKSHGVPIKIIDYEKAGNGERFIYTIKLKPGTRENAIFSRARDIQSALHLPLFQPFYEGLDIRIAVSEHPVRENSLPKILRSPEFYRNKMRICVPLGYSMRGTMQFYDLANDSAPHTLIGGGSGGGKSVFLGCTTISIAHQPVSNVNMVIIDCGGNSLDIFGSLPHLSHPIVKDTDNVYKVLTEIVDEMERRLALSNDELMQLPKIVIIWDEYNSTIKNITDNDERKALTNILEDLLRRARKTGIHIVLATQESYKQDMLISLNNFNAKIAFRCSDFYNSRSIIGTAGAESLPGRGAMLFKSPEQLKPLYVQGAFITDKELEQTMSLISSKIRDLNNKFVIPKSELPPPLLSGFISVKEESINIDAQKELAEIIMWTLQQTIMSAEKIKNAFKMGNRAYDIIERLENMSIISEKYSNQPRSVIPQTVEDLSEEVISLILNNGFTEEDIENAFHNRKGGETL